MHSKMCLKIGVYWCALNRALLICAKLLDTLLTTLPGFFLKHILEGIELLIAEKQGY